MAIKAQVISGAGATASACFLIQPFDVVKTAYLTGKDSTTVWQAFNFVHRRYGVRGYWRGIPASLTRSLIGGGAGFPILQVLKSVSPDSFSSNVVCSALSRASVILLVSPLTVLKVRMQAPQSTSYRTLREGLVSIYKTGGVRGYYVGVGPNLMRDMPFSGLAYGFYQYFLEWFSLFGGEAHRSLANFGSASCGSAAATILTQPFDVLKTRLQFAGIDKHKYHNYGTVFNGLRTIWRHEGLRGFTRGFSIRVTEKSISFAFVWVIYEKFKDMITMEH